MIIGYLHIFFGLMSIQFLCPFLNWVVCFWFQVVEVLYISWVLIPYQIYDIRFANIFSHSIGCLFTLLIVSSGTQKF